MTLEVTSGVPRGSRQPERMTWEPRSVRMTKNLILTNTTADNQLR